MFKNQYTLSRFRRFGKAQGKRFIFYGCLQPFQPVQPGLTPPGHFTFDAGLETPDVRFLFRDKILLGLVGRPFCPRQDILLDQIFCVITRKGTQMTAFHFQYPGGNMIQKSPVMAYYQHAALKIPQIAFQPFHHPDVQMVGRFVQQHKIRRRYQRRRKHQTRLLTTRKCGCVHLPHRFRKRQAKQDHFQFCFIIISVQIFVTLGNPAIAVQNILAAGSRRSFQFFQFFSQG